MKKGKRRFDSVVKMFRRADRWIKGSWAGIRDDEGVVVGTYGPAAAREPDINCWCLDGALSHVYGEGTKRYLAAGLRLRKAIFNNDKEYVEDHGILDADEVGYIDWNDEPGRTVKEVRRIVRLAKV